MDNSRVINFFSIIDQNSTNKSQNILNSLTIAVKGWKPVSELYSSVLQQQGLLLSQSEQELHMQQ